MTYSNNFYDISANLHFPLFLDSFHVTPNKKIKQQILFPSYSKLFTDGWFLSGMDEYLKIRLLSEHENEKTKSANSKYCPYWFTRVLYPYRIQMTKAVMIYYVFK